MSSTRFPRGSEWRKWDLHVHTPHSALNNGFGTDFDEYAKRLFAKAVELGVAVIGVTDYFSISGYRALRAIQRDESGRLEAMVGPTLAAAAREILLLPNIELRSSIVIPQGTDPARRVNFHVIFSDDVAPETIEEHFFREIKFTAEAGPSGPDEVWSLTKENLESLGRKLKEQHAPFRVHTDLFAGMLNAVVPHEGVTAALAGQPSRFWNKYLLVVSADEDLSKCSWDGQAHLARKLFLQKAHMLFSNNEGTREFGLGKRHKTIAAFVAEFKSLKPCITGSDAHTFAGLFQPPNGRQLWVRADPTFIGLAQLLNEPEGRVRIGDTPPLISRASEKATKYMVEIGFQRTEGAKQGHDWFSGAIPMSLGLIAIIGNKGGGKSALADILALLGDSKMSKYFSFLTGDRFLAARARLGAMYEAQVHWLSGQKFSKVLNERVDPTKPELVKYIPQNYLETICTELKEVGESEFERELTEVIFSHVDKANRFRRESLPELLEFLTEEKAKRISQLMVNLSSANRAIVALETQLEPAFRVTLEAQLELRRSELRSHDAAIPSKQIEPNSDEKVQSEMEAVKTELAGVVQEIEKLDEEIGDIEEKLSTDSLQVAAAERLLSRVGNFEQAAELFFEASKEDSAVLGVDARSVVRIEVDRAAVLEMSGAAAERVGSARKALNPGEVGSLSARREAASARAAAVRSKLDEPNRRFQEYLHDLAKWSKRRSEIEGTPEIPESIQGLEAKINELDQVPALIQQWKNSRREFVQGIVGAKSELLADYRRLYAPVQEFIDKHPVSQEQGALQFSARMDADHLVEGFLDFIHQGRKGSFQGEIEARERLRELIAEADFSDQGGVESFLERVQWHLDHAPKGSADQVVLVRDQLRQSRSVEGLYDYLYGLEYLFPRFELRWQGKSLDQLSPGERGTLLLVFYLLIDRRDSPLIIDQPEENLDNQTVATLLVPAIKYAKERRQLVIVTHNPNLAVVCDADQIIHAHLEKSTGNAVTYTSGAIEEPIIAQLLVDVLEGTKPAFDLRDAKYEILERW